MDAIKVIVVTGMGRSGSTLVERVLGETPGLAPTGVVRRVIRREPRRCGCGVAVAECPFWAAVTARAFGHSFSFARPWRLAREVERPRSLIPVRPRRQARARTAYLEANASLFEAVCAEARATAVVDSSKDPVRTYLLSRSARFDVRAVHLVRDPRAVVASWARGSTAEHSATPGVAIRAWTPGHALRRWVESQALAGLLSIVGVKTTRVRYEDFVAEPVATVDRLLTFAGVVERPTGLTGSSFVAGLGHQVGGNPMKHASGTVAIRRDATSVKELKFGWRVWVTAVTLPWLLAYRYPLWPR